MEREVVDSGLVLEPRAPITGKIIQLLAWNKVLIALTDLGDIWLLHGFDAMGSGTQQVSVEWRRLGLEIPQAEIAPVQRGW